jgi:chromosome partitioning protein
MNVVVFASRKGGSGKSTLTAHLGAYANKPSRSCILIDADPQGSLTLWHKLRGADAMPLRAGTRGISDIVKAAKKEGYDWAFIDTPPNISSAAVEAIRAATLVVIPARPTLFDLSAVAETIETARQLRKPYAVVINGAPPKRNDQESPLVVEAREGLSKLKVPVWAGQITSRTTFSISLSSGEGAHEYDGASYAAAEIAALWSAIDKSVKAINGAYSAANAMHSRAAA